MKMNPAKLFLGLGLVSCVLFSQPAYALSIRLSDGTSTVTVDDNLAGDSLAGVLGKILFSGGVGDWNINVETATSKPLIGSAASPFITLTSDNTYNSSASLNPLAPLTILVSDTGFTGTPVDLVALINNTANSGVTAAYKTYYDSANTLFATTTALTDSGSLTGLFNSSKYASAAPGSLYSLTMEIVLTPTSTSGNITYDASLAVPDGGLTLALFGFALVGVESLRRKMSA